MKRMKRWISREKKSKFHNKWVEEIFKNPAKLPIKIEGEIIKKLKFPKSFFGKRDKRELTDIILVTKKEEIIHIYFVEIKTGIFANVVKAKYQIKTALTFFLKEFDFWKEKLEIKSYDRMVIHSLLIWVDKTVVPPSLKLESEYQISINKKP